MKVSHLFSAIINHFAIFLGRDPYASETSRKRIRELEQANDGLRQMLVKQQTLEEELRNSRTMLLNVINSTTDAVFTKDLHGRYTLFSVGAEKISGKSADDVLGKDDNFIFPVAEALAVMEGDHRVIEAGAVKSYEYMLTNAAGKEITILTTKGPLFDSDGKIIGLFGISRDISERKQMEESLRESEKRFKKMFHRHSAVMLLIEPNSGSIIDANLASEVFYGYSHETLLTMNILDINTLPPDRIAEEMNCAQNEKRNYFIFPHKTAGGKTITVEVHSTPIELNNTTMLFSIIHDITDRQRAEEKLRRTLQESENTSKTMKRLLRTVAHEFRTPLGLLTGSADILDRYWDRLSPEKQFEQTERIRSAANQLSSLINSVISFNQFGADRCEAPPVFIDIACKCRTIASEIETVWSAGHTFNVAISDCGSALLNEIRLRQILENLLTNALRYTPSDGAVSLHVHRKKDRLLIEISDTGIGIPEDDLMHIFKAFFRCRNISGQRGLGLGLSIVNDALAQMGGTIIVTSKVAEGTIMRVEIPLADSNVQSWG